MGCKHLPCFLLLLFHLLYMKGVAQTRGCATMDVLAANQYVSFYVYCWLGPLLRSICKGTQKGYQAIFFVPSFLCKCIVNISERKLLHTIFDKFIQQMIKLYL
jgi:hypothetical protein